MFNKIDLYVTSNTVIEDRCTYIAVREQYNIRNDIDHLPFATNYKAVIESMCNNQLTVLFVIYIVI